MGRKTKQGLTIELLGRDLKLLESTALQHLQQDSRAESPGLFARASSTAHPSDLTRRASGPTPSSDDQPEPELVLPEVEIPNTGHRDVQSSNVAVPNLYDFSTWFRRTKAHKTIHGNAQLSDEVSTMTRRGEPAANSKV
ncbi:hypothetical protein B7463_g12617, partial [Scytalidium lignicola]